MYNAIKFEYSFISGVKYFTRENTLNLIVNITHFRYFEFNTSQQYYF